MASDNCCLAVQIDGRVIGSGERGPVCAKLQRLYRAAMDAQAQRGRLNLDHK